ncbi:MAG: hypothetical protein OXU20_17720, partial [Myxococcales bacterium]|nr:hypothetical protein [Myxococcales bacterium]
SHLSLSGHRPLPRSGFVQVVLWVLEGNRRARSFYEASQFVSDGTLKLDDRWGDFVLRELRYRRPLGPDS